MIATHRGHGLFLVLLGISALSCHRVFPFPGGQVQGVEDAAVVQDTEVAPEQSTTVEDAASDRLHAPPMFTVTADNDTCDTALSVDLDLLSQGDISIEVDVAGVGDDYNFQFCDGVPDVAIRFTNVPGATIPITCAGEGNISYFSGSACDRDSLALVRNSCTEFGLSLKGYLIICTAGPIRITLQSPSN